MLSVTAVPIVPRMRDDTSSIVRFFIATASMATSTSSLRRPAREAGVSSIGSTTLGVPSLTVMTRPTPP